jgi:hypothetical protein
VRETKCGRMNSSPQEAGRPLDREEVWLDWRAAFCGYRLGVAKLSVSADAAIIMVSQRRLVDFIQIVKDPRRCKQLIREELRALTVRLWDWVRFA